MQAREELERAGVEAFACMGDIAFGLIGVTANTMKAIAFLRRELDDTGIVVNPTKTIALPPNTEMAHSDCGGNFAP